MTDNGPDNGLELLQDYVAQNPSSERFAELAEAYVEEGRFDDAIRLCEIGLGYHPGNPAGHLVYAKALVSSGKIPEGIQSFERACTLRSDDVGIWADACKFLADQGLVQESLPYFQSAKRIDSTDPRVISLRNRLEEALGSIVDFQINGKWNPLLDGQPSQSLENGDEPFSPDQDSLRQDEQVASLDDDDDDDEPPTMYVDNPLAALKNKADEPVVTQSQSPEPLGDQDRDPLQEKDLGTNSDESLDSSHEPPRSEQETQFDPMAGLAAEISDAVNVLAMKANRQEPPTKFDPSVEDQQIAAPDRNEPPTKFDDGQGADFSPWQLEPSNPDVSRPEPPTRLASEIEKPIAEKKIIDKTRVSSSRPKGPAFPEQINMTTATNISYWKVFMVVVPFVLVAVAGGLFFGYKHLKDEKAAGLMEQSLGAFFQDSFSGYSDARLTLKKLLELDPDSSKGKSLLACVLARLHDEYGPNLKFRDEARSIINSMKPADGSENYLIWARYHLSSGDRQEIKADLDNLIRKKPKDQYLMALEGELAARRGELQQAAKWFLASLEQDPSNTRTLYRYAMLEVQQGNPQRAMQYLVRAVTINPLHVRSLLALAKVRIDQKLELKQATEDLEKILELPKVTNTDGSQAHFLLAHLYFIDNQRTKALENCKAASDMRQADPGFLKKIATLCMDYYEIEEATIQSNRVLKLSPDDTDAMLIRINGDLARGKCNDALSSLNSLVGKKVPAGRFLLLRGEALLRTQHYEAALKDLDGILDDAPQRPQARALRVLALIGMEELEGARREVVALQKKYPQRAMPHLAMGYYRLAKGLKRGAKAAFRKAVELNPREYRAYYALGKLAFESRHYKQARKSLIESLAVNPYSADTLYLLGKVELKLAEPDKALELFARVVKDQPSSGTGLIGMAEALLELGKVEKALVAIKKAKKTGVGDAHSLYIEGKVYLANGRFHSAIRALKDADRLLSKNPDILADLGLSYLGTRNITKAQKAFEQSLKYSRRRRKLPRAQEGLARTLAARAKWKDAAAAYEKAAYYAAKKGWTVEEITRLYLKAGRTMLKDKRAGDRRYSRARRLFRKAMRKSPESPEPVYELAAAFDREEKLRSARKYYERVLEMEPKHALTLYRLGLLEFDDGKEDRAKVLLSRFLKIRPKGKLARMARKILRRIK